MTDLPPLPEIGVEAPPLSTPEVTDVVEPAQPAEAPRPSQRKLGSWAEEWWALGSFLVLLAVLIAGVVWSESSGEPASSGARVAFETNASTEVEAEPAVIDATLLAGDAATPRGDDDPIRFGTPVYIRLGAAEPSVWRLVVEAPTLINTDEDSDYKTDVAIDLVASGGPGAVEMPQQLGTHNEAWRVSWGGLTRAPDQQRCAQQPTFSTLPETIRMQEGERITGSLCLRAPGFLPLGTVVSDYDDNGLVEFVTALGDVVFTSDGRADDRIDFDASLAQVDGVGLAFDSPIPLDRGFGETPDIWNLSIGTPRDQAGRALGDPALAELNDVEMVFPVTSTLVESAAGESSRHFMLSYLIGGQTGTRYSVDIGGQPCSGSGGSEIGWVYQGYTSVSPACVQISGADAASGNTVFALSSGFDLLFFRLSGTQPPPAPVPPAIAPDGIEFGTPFVVEDRWQEPTTSWTIESARAAKSGQGDMLDVIIELAAEPASVPVEFDVDPLKVLVLGGSTHQVYTEPCDGFDQSTELLSRCVQIPEVDVDDPSTRYVLQVRYEFIVFDPTA